MVLTHPTRPSLLASRSCTVWHIMGMLYRADKNMPEAVKYYRSALRCDPENQTVLRDLALLYVHTRDFRAHHDVRRQLLMAKANVAASWVGLAVAHQLAGNADLALAVLDQYEATQENPRAAAAAASGVPTPAARIAAYEASEVVLFRARVLEQSGAIQKAMRVLADGLASGRITDSMFAEEKRAELQLRLGAVSAAAASFVSLLHRNPESVALHRGLAAAVVGLDATGGVAALRAPAGSPQPPLSPSASAALFAVTVALVSAQPRARMPRRRLLDILPADHAAFAPVLSALLRSSLRKGVPALFAELKGLYRGEGEGNGLRLSWAQRLAARRARGAPAGAAATAKGAVLSRLIAEFRASADRFTTGGAERLPALRATLLSEGDAQRLLGEAAAALRSHPVATAGGAGSSEPACGDADAPTTRPLTELATATGTLTIAAVMALAVDSGDADAADAGESPSVLPWLALLAARDADERGDVAGALAVLDEGLKHSPTVLDLYVARARVEKHAGQLASAALTMDRARALDLADRYLNTKAVLYLLRAGAIPRAERAAALFTRHDVKDGVGADPLGHLKDMQAAWYELSAGAAAERANHFGVALKHYTRLELVFAEWMADQYDFHGYSLRRLVLRAYVDMLAWVDGVRSHPYFLAATAGAARCYAMLAAMPPAARARAAAPPSWALPAPIVVAAADAGKAKKSAGDAPAAAAAATTAQNEDGKPAVDDDPHGVTLASSAKPLDDAARSARALTDNLPARLLAAVAAATTAAEIASGVRQATPTAGSWMRAGGKYEGATANTAVEAHALAADVAIARGKPALAASHLRAAAKAAAAADCAVTAAAASVGVDVTMPAAGCGHPLVVLGIARLLRLLEKGAPTATAAAAAWTAAREAVATLAGGADITADAFVKAAAAAAGNSLPLATAALRAHMELHMGVPALPAGALASAAVVATATPLGANADAAASLVALGQRGADVAPPTLEDIRGALDLGFAALACGLVERATVDALRAALHPYYTGADVLQFDPPRVPENEDGDGGKPVLKHSAPSPPQIAPTLIEVADVKT